MDAVASVEEVQTGPELVDDGEIDVAARELAEVPPLVVLRWAERRFGQRLVFATAFGASGCVLVDLIGRYGLSIDVVTLDTGLLFAETYEVWHALEERYGITIRAVRPALTVAEQAARYGDRLWARDPDRCCEMRKVQPLRAALADRDAWIASIRRDETAARATAAVVERDALFGRVKVNPLLSWSAEDVASHLRRHEVPTHPLLARGYSSVGCVPCTTAVAQGEDPRAGRWRGRAKNECGLHLRATGSQALPVVYEAGRPAAFQPDDPSAAAAIDALVQPTGEDR